jgi:hypothetical protein
MGLKLAYLGFKASKRLKIKKIFSFPDNNSIFALRFKIQLIDFK